MMLRPLWVSNLSSPVISKPECILRTVSFPHFLEKEEVYHIRTKPCFHIHQIKPAHEEFVINSDISVELVITNNLIGPLNLDGIALSLTNAVNIQKEAEAKQMADRQRNLSICSDLDVESVNKLNGWMLVPEVSSYKADMFLDLCKFRHK